MGSLLPISACILTKDEEDLIAETIRSVTPYVREVIVLDTGSQDNTVHIARTCGAKVFETEWLDDFAAARNHLLGLAQEEYIFMIDADERYQGKGEDLKRYIQAKHRMPGRIKIINELDQGENSVSYITRLIPNNGQYSYRGSIHEQLYCSDESVSGMDTEITVLHEGYKKSILEKKKKTDRNLRLLMKQLNDYPQDPYVLFQIGKTLYVAKDYSQANEYLAASYHLLMNEEAYDYTFTPNVVLQYCYCLLKEKKWLELRNILGKALEKYPNYTDLYFIQASSIIESGNVQEFHSIPNIYYSCLELGEVRSGTYETVAGVGSYRALYNLGIYFEITGQIERAKEYYAASAKQGFIQATKRLEILD
ncbi:tetratricopeptide repeat-containing glycosyltransferase family 2 protein [Paenibacillus massiliensis]|uniref:tetratricopeptide repeat-containing glycosyltransferase family 2 protein n=1 Tax=Paenibacillus massiliensis TaxID=225917 RepID=UPI00041B1435|nr:glycosyltransferase family 2 protein [Paenibacillus massiliensis]